MNAVAPGIIKERPLIFKSESVNGILEDRKTQTRRIVKDKRFSGVPDDWAVSGIVLHGQTRFNNGPSHHQSLCDFQAKCPRGIPGDKIWVKENYHTEMVDDLFKPSELSQTHSPIFYSADDPQNANLGVKRPSIFMCRWMSRILLEITDIRVERLNDITRDDVYYEGLIPQDGCEYDEDGKRRRFFQNPIAGFQHESLYDSEAFSLLWESVNGKGSWDLNPWVWVIEFKRIDNGHT